MSKSKARTRLEKHLAIGMALVNGANTFAPMALLYARPDQVLGRQQNLPDSEQPVAARISASQDRKPYSAAGLQNLAYSAMSALDHAVFGKAEAFTSVVGSGGTTNYAVHELVENGTQNINSGGIADTVSVFEGGTQIVNKGGHTINVEVVSGAWLIVNSGGVVDGGTVHNAVEIVNAGGTSNLSVYYVPLDRIMYQQISGSRAYSYIATMSAAAFLSDKGKLTQYVYDGGTSIVKYSNNCNQIISGSGAYGSFGLLENYWVGKGQVISNGGTGIVGTMSLSQQVINDGAYGSVGALAYRAHQTVSAGGSGDVGTIGDGGSDDNTYQEIASGGTGSAHIVSEYSQQKVYGYGTIAILSGGTQQVNGYGTIAIVNGGTQQVNEGTGLIATMSSGTQNVDISAYGSIGTMDAGKQAVTLGSGDIGTMENGLQITTLGTVGIGTMNNGTQKISQGGTGTITDMYGGTQQTYSEAPSALSWVYPNIEARANIGIMHAGTQLVYSNGVASIGTMESGLQQVFNSGSASITIMNGGQQDIFADATGTVETMNGGTQNISSGGSGSVTTMLGGTQDVKGNGTIESMSGGTQDIISGSGTITNMYSGRQEIESGAYGSITTMNSGLGMQNVYSGATGSVTTMNGGRQDLLNGTGHIETLNADGIQRMSGSQAYGSVTTMNGGTQLIYYGATGDVATMNDGIQDIGANGVGNVDDMEGGTQDIYGTAVSTTVEGGTQILESGGKLSLNTFASGTQIIASGASLTADASGAALSVQAAALSKGTQIVQSGGTATGFDLTGAKQVVAGLAVSTTVDAGLQDVSGGTAVSTTINQGGMQDVNNGTAISTTINGGTQNLNGTATATNTTINSGTQNVNSGAMATSTTMLGGVQNVNSGANASATTITSGTQNLNGGTAGQTTLNAGGVQNVNADGWALGAMISSGGTQNVNNNGQAWVAVVNAGGVQNLNSGAISLFGVIKGGTQNVAGGAASQLVTMSGGELNIAQDGYVELGIKNAGATDSYDVTTMNINGGYVDVGDITLDGYSTAGDTLNITNLNGSGNFGINTDVAGGKSDTINIANATNSTANTITVNYDPYFDIADTGAELKGTTIVATAPAGVKFTTDSSEYGPISFTPTLSQDASGNWILTGYTEKASENTLTAVDTHEIMNQAWFATVNSLSKRLGDLRQHQLYAAQEFGTRSTRTGQMNTKDDGTTISLATTPLSPSADDGIWARYQRATTQANRGRMAELNANLLQVGYDKAFNVKNGVSYVGIAVDHLNGTGEYERGSSKVSGNSVALYNTWLGNKGHYYDVILRQGNFNNDYHLTDLSKVESTGDYNIQATTLSGDYGFRKELKGGSWYEPQAELILGHLSSADYTTKYRWKNWDVHVDATNHFITRLGIAAGTKISNGSIYGRTSYYHDFGGADSSITYGAYAGERAALRDWVELTAGGEFQLDRNLQVYGELTKYLGDLTNNLNVNVGLRWSF